MYLSSITTGCIYYCVFESTILLPDSDRFVVLSSLLSHPQHVNRNRFLKQGFDPYAMRYFDAEMARIINADRTSLLHATTALSDRWVSSLKYQQRQ